MSLKRGEGNMRPRGWFNNLWKMAFFILLAVVIGFTALVYTRVTTTRTTYDANAPKVAHKNEPVLDVVLKKGQINNIVEFFFADAVKESGMDYQFTLGSDAMLDGTFQLLGHDTHFYLYFEPYVLNDGNVQLKAKHLSVGSLNVPIPAMINYISRSMDFPEWVEIDADKQLITLHLDQFTLENGMGIRANKINLIDDEISFSLFLPTKESKKK